MLDKLEFVQSLIQQFPGLKSDAAMNAWWQNPRGGWRLNHEGFAAFEQCKLEHWDYEIPRVRPLQPIVLLILDQKITQPYYIKLGKKPQLCFFDSKEATMYALYGDIDRFIAGLRLN